MIVKINCTVIDLCLSPQLENGMLVPVSAGQVPDHMTHNTDSADSNYYTTMVTENADTMVTTDVETNPDAVDDGHAMVTDEVKNVLVTDSDMVTDESMVTDVVVTNENSESVMDMNSVMVTGDMISGVNSDMDVNSSMVTSVNNDTSQQYVVVNSDGAYTTLMQVHSNEILMVDSQDLVNNSHITAT